jgi:hypothetical protein
MMLFFHEFWNSSLVLDSGSPDRIFVVFLITIGKWWDSISNYATPASWQCPLVFIRYEYLC